MIVLIEEVVAQNLENAAASAQAADDDEISRLHLMVEIPETGPSEVGIIQIGIVEAYHLRNRTVRLVRELAQIAYVVPPDGDAIPLLHEFQGVQTLLMVSYHAPNLHCCFLFSSRLLIIGR
ncbi:MAG: hypothetical protein U9Q35_03160 [Pseudomonadota bacterium]|nr:hypothetical protein [Pseudomonadota bacterium]